MVVVYYENLSRVTPCVAPLILARTGASLTRAKRRTLSGANQSGPIRTDQSERTNQPAANSPQQKRAHQKTKLARRRPAMEVKPFQKHDGGFRGGAGTQPVEEPFEDTQQRFGQLRTEN